MANGNIRRRLASLEERVSPPAPELSPEAEMDGVYETWWLHAAGYTVGLFTDREINLLGALYVLHEMSDRTHTFPSVTVVEWVEHDDDTCSLYLDGHVEIVDLPERISKNVDRMGSEEQRAREQYLREDPRRYSEHILGAYRISKTKKPPKYIPRGVRS